jgi:hypothetical protein
VQLGKTPKVSAECVVIVWYDHTNPKKADTPVVAEFSFKYGDSGKPTVEARCAAPISCRARIEALERELAVVREQT